MTAPLADRVLAGDARAVARAISLIEDDDPRSAELIRAIYPRTGRAYVIGVTGPPGAGKSTLVDRLTTELRRSPERSVLNTREDDGARASGVGDGPLRRSVLNTRERNGASASGVGVGPHAVSKVGVIAVDPTSPFTGGAVLGDRLRMQGHAVDEGVFIRSMATRGHLGGLARATADASLVLDASGCDIVLIETVGVGQDEVDIVRTADVSIVTLVPGAGDEVQALKAGIMEIADIFVVNKADRDGADRLAAAIASTETLKTFSPGEWQPPILKTIATTGEGIVELLDAVARFRDHEAGRRTDRRQQRAENQVRDLITRRFLSRLERQVLAPGELQAVAARVAARELDPYTAADELLARGSGLKA